MDTDIHDKDAIDTGTLWWSIEKMRRDVIAENAKVILMLTLIKLEFM